MRWVDSFDADGERPVSRAEAIWFRNGGYAPYGDFTAKSGINRKFTPNQINRAFREFSPI
jgi:hypothetical protein